MITMLRLSPKLVLTENTPISSLLDLALSPQATSIKIVYIRDS
jgi:hypothetical protein